MNRQEVGQAIFDKIKEYVEAAGDSMHQTYFPKKFPISRRKCYDIRRGNWTEKILEKLPFKVDISYTVRFRL